MMKIKTKRILYITLCVILLVGVCASMHLFSISNKGYLPELGVVPDEATAIKIAEAVWLPIYGNTIYSKQPFVAQYDEKGMCWIVRGTLRDGTLGGVPEIKIDRNDGKILYISHGK
jgi:hypothetical protein